ncbi:uncharacterized protein FIBRA_04166 [Fibroporia radiculosa]|uniref:ubiquitinyl hydrolase 1 n=1 Tax=Fibroporia radiculosa TaxID=599839 RepID=J4H2T6_9APHY|nr:uncharacterized protein FIBRA_04166 [Fibroporia radiculosa]CCM02089.1 predicted protein [Fibroporia radiculosa]
MPPKRTRRRSPTQVGLNVGERLKRTKLVRTSSLSAWDWVGTEVLSASDISQDHLMATCGFSERNMHSLCPTKYVLHAPTEAPTAELRASGELEDDAIIISDDERPTCSGKGCRSNPYCLNYLGQDKWEDEEKARKAFLKASDLGESPLVRSRKPGHPIGLKVWFQDLAFRNGVYKCQLPQGLKQEAHPIFQLQVTFAAMQECTQSSFNPIRLVESLKLRTSEQQDAQEFSKLFMAHLDAEFRKQQDPTLKTLIADQFQGKQVYGTICERCQHRSERLADFLEIEVNIKNHATLEDRISAALEPEILTGDNKYLCPQCDSLQDAKRYTELRDLPPVLHFSLLRFVYDLSSMERKKSKHTMSFPTIVDMDRFLGSLESRGCAGEDIDEKRKNLYELRGVLLHKGASAYHGHYEAQVFDMRNGAWYQYNDETVTKLDPSAFDVLGQLGGSMSSEQKNKSKENTVKQHSNSRKRRRVDDSDSETEIIGSRPSPKDYEKTPSSALGYNFFDLTSPYAVTEDSSPRYISSRDAYMLVYARADNSNYQLGTHLPAIEPPAAARQAVKVLNDGHEVACNAYIEKESKANLNFSRTRSRIMSIYRTWSVATREMESVVVSRRELESWMLRYLSETKRRTVLPAEGSQGPNSIDADSMAAKEGDIEPAQAIVCAHGRLDPTKANEMKVITKVAYERISSEDGVELLPKLTPLDVCAACVQEAFHERLYQIEHPQSVAHFDEIYLVHDNEPGFWISKQWLKDWRLAKPKMHVACRDDPSPDSQEFNRHVRCEHGGLSANAAARRRISTEACLFLQEIFPGWQALSADCELCPVCEALAQISKEDKREVRKQAEEEKAKLKRMHDDTLHGNTALLKNIPCAIVPAEFVRSWRQWLQRPGEISRPQAIDNSEFICEHGLLCIDPNTAFDIEASIAIIERADWDILEKIYSAGPLVAVENDGTQMRSEVAVCDECCQKRKLDYEVAEVIVRVLGANDPIPTVKSYSEESNQQVKRLDPPIAMTYGSRKAGGLRQSNRIRLGKNPIRRRRITITRMMTVKDIKVLIQEELNIPVISQQLFYRGQELDGSSLSVSSIGILSNDVLDLREQHEEINLLSDSDDDHGNKKRREGLGFGGTLLGGLATNDIAEPTSDHELRQATTLKSCSTCTFDNDSEALVCAMCESSL